VVISRDPAGDTEDPGVETGRLPPEAADAGHGPGHGLIHHVVGHLPSHPAHGVGVEARIHMAIEAFPRLFVAVAGHLHQAALLARVHVITLYMANTDAVLRTSLAPYRSGLPPSPGPTPPDAEGTAPRGAVPSLFG